MRFSDQVPNYLFRLGVFDRIAAWNRKRVPILMYHGVTKSAEPFPLGLEYRKGSVLFAEKFLEQMQYLRVRYRIVPLGTVVSHLSAGTPLPDRCAVITFDDGYRNNYAVAYPILKRLDLPATMFVPTDFVSGKSPLWVDRIEYALHKTHQELLQLNVMGRQIDVSLKNYQERRTATARLKALLKHTDQSWRSEVVGQLEEKAAVALGGPRDDQGDYAPLMWDEIAEMEGSGLITIGSHSMTHPILPRCSSEEITRELVLSKALLEKTLGRTCDLFSYPNGDFDVRTRTAVTEAGYSAATSTKRGLCDNRSDLLAIERIGVPGRLSLAEFAARVSGGRSLLLRMKSMVVSAAQKH